MIKLGMGFEPVDAEGLEEAVTGGSFVLSGEVTSMTDEEKVTRGGGPATKVGMEGDMG